MSQQFSVDEYDAELPQLQTDGRVYDLIDGHLFPLPLYSRLQSQVMTQLFARLSYHGDLHSLGQTFDSRTGYTLNDKTVLHPSLSFPANDRHQSDDHHRINGAPTIAIELIPTDIPSSQLEERIYRYLQAGTEQVWGIFVDDRSAEVYTRTDDGIYTDELGMGDTLSAPHLLPDFELPLYTIFPLT